ncbi:tryptophanyl-tRNA synthetase [Desulfofarcimen acetoxidans DSM 771]|uniref:Tryptophan--tRNA ligase n=1 Tax=Desulfofarcimen acetoxidans (strain ATCC 49208 / DSM 771 / KCTC 5769 / VKM B-1644 / 5575) TaxID=485916 RepID=C8VZ08_DESAS|nr:tryptophan--tRNA ligase [Desulfofarcimen acetoxidans]ACV62918.1 tryptophanyl-tRNA synthetase [Desulfofarcimen acetoxidans DSM 771]
MRVLSGIQPSGSLHLGNYFGMMKRMIDYQENHELFCFLVNYHALTTVFDSELLRRQTFEAVCDFLALGLDPEKSVFWVQSDVPEVTELTWILSNVTGMGLLERCHAFKDKTAKGIPANHGLFAYPVLMAADILLFGGEKVPVGKDQKQHLEVAKDIALRFNNAYGETFVVPEPDIEEDFAVVPGTDGQKMSKSYGNNIEIFADEKTLKKKIMGIMTDSTPVDQPKPVEGNILFDLYSLFLDDKDKEKLKERFITPGLKYGDLKKEILAVIWEYFAPYRQEREKIVRDKAYVLKTMQKGANKARQAAAVYLEKAKHNVGLDYRSLL